MTHVDNPEIITVLSLCSGYGGLELGLSRALANPLRVVAVEIEAYGLANLVAKAEEGKLAVEALWPDLRTFPAERFRGCFDFILAGYPCQPFSVAGKRQGTDDPRHLWPAIARIIEAVSPVSVFLENVPGHLSLGFASVYQSLHAMGYSVEAGLFTAAECGAPHKRERLFILAHHRSTNDAARMQSETVGNRSGQLADSECSRQPQSQGCVTEQRGRTEHGVEAMADAERPGARPGILQDAQAGIGRDRLAEQRWPARPGEPQYEWEEPRVVANAKSSRREECRAKRNERAYCQGNSSSNSATQSCTSSRKQGQNSKAQSGLGGTVDGIANRVDRLRLLGNGVVPQQAERAFRELYERIVALFSP